jgi:hypothetical protein
MDMKTPRAACAAPLSFADYQEIQLHQCPDLTVLGISRLERCVASIVRRGLGKLIVDRSTRAARIPTTLGRSSVGHRLGAEEVLDLTLS